MKNPCAHIDTIGKGQQRLVTVLANEERRNPFDEH
jgi:hypothetical protein